MAFGCFLVFMPVKMYTGIRFLKLIIFLGLGYIPSKILWHVELLLTICIVASVSYTENIRQCMMGQQA